MNNTRLAKNLAECAMFVAIICISAYISIPFFPVAITLQAVVCLICGALLGAKRAAFCTLIYALIGVLGLPVFSNFTGGYASFKFPSFGYILGFIPASFTCGLLIQRQKNKSFLNIFAAMTSSLLILYAVGIIYFSLVWVYFYNGAQTLIKTLLLYNVTYFPKDVVLAALSAIICKKIYPLIYKF